MSKYKPLLVTLPEEHIRFLERTAYQRSASGHKVNAGYVASGILMGAIAHMMSEKSPPKSIKYPSKEEEEK
jgi:hypothetical protein